MVAEGTARSAATRQALVEAAIETLKAEGFTGASARAIAGRAGCNQALVFYHFGSVVGLLLAAIDSVSATRLERYSTAVERVRSPVELVEVAAVATTLVGGRTEVMVTVLVSVMPTPPLGKVNPFVPFL